MIRSRSSEHFDTIVIGAGQAGLSTGYYLKQQGRDFVILDANERIGDSWRQRWDSLRLFTPTPYNSLPGWPFPAPNHTFPTKDEMAAYLESYAARFDLPVMTGTRVERLVRNGDEYELSTTRGRFEARNIVVAMSNYQRPHVPSFASELNPDIVQFHSSEYRNPSQLQEGPVLLVGAGNSASEIAMELAPHHRIWMSGRNTGQIPFRVEGLAGRLILVRLTLRLLFHRVLAVGTPIGRKMRPKIVGKGGPLIRVKAEDLAAAGVERVPKTAGVRDGLPLLEDGRVLDVANVIWCTGYHPGFAWIDLPIFDGPEEHPHEPIHERGVVPGQPGLYFVGLHFQTALSSAMIHGVGRDAAYIAGKIAARAATEARQEHLRSVASGEPRVA